MIFAQRVMYLHDNRFYSATSNYMNNMINGTEMLFNKPMVPKGTQNN